MTCKPNIILPSEPEHEDSLVGARLTFYSFLLEVAYFKMYLHLPCLHSMAQVKQTMIPLMRPRISGSEIPNIFLPLKYIPHIATTIWGARNRFFICGIMCLHISCSQVHYLAHTYLIPPQEAHKSIPLKEVVHARRNCP